MNDVFVSYRWVDPDQRWVREQLAPALRNAGLKVLLDVDTFIPGRDLILEMTRAGHDSRRVLCVLSPDYFDGNRMVAFESLMARRQDPSGNEPVLIPLMLRSTSLPEWLRGLVFIDWTDPNCQAREWRKLLKVLGAPREAPAPGPIGATDTIPDVRPAKAPKYYVYISDSKVNMLYAQGRGGTNAPQDSISKLDVILADLERAGCVGTVDDPKEYFAGAMQMRWGPCVFPHVPQLTPSPLVYFGGTTNRTVVGLGGSAKHVLGNVGLANVGLHSCLPYFIVQLRRELGEALPIEPAKFGNQALGGVYLATMLGTGPSQGLEFVAKQLAQGPCKEGWRVDKQDNRKVLVGTPLYVAISE